MPSMSKKQSKKAASRISNSYDTNSPLGSSSSSSCSTPLPQVTEEQLLSSLEEASTKFPSLIGRSAFIAQLTDIDTELGGCRISLSESSMVASSLKPGSTVSVSLASSRRRYSTNFALSSLVEEFTQHSGVTFEEKFENEAGNYFALATVSRPCKALKNGVRLSSNLSWTLGNPASGRTLFVYPIQSQSLNGLLHGCKLPSTKVDWLSVYNCKEIFLELISSKIIPLNSNTSSHRNLPGERTHNPVEMENVSSSPRTPLILRSKLKTPDSSSQLTSSGYEESGSNLTSTYPFDVGEVLGNEYAKKLLQTRGSLWLCSRSLFRGNLVTIPILGELCLFQVRGANEMSENGAFIDEPSRTLFTEDFDKADYANGAFLVSRETKIHLYSGLASAPDTPQKGGKPESKDIEAVSQGDFTKLGGLSKEYEDLKDIIISSSVKGTLSRLGLRPIKGVLLHGPPGTGKTSLARLCARDAGVNLFTVNGPEIVNQYYGESEQALHGIFDSATKAAPAVVFIDELDAIAPARKEGGEELSQRMVATLLNLMDGISRTDGLLVVAATNRIESVEPALRRPGRLDREIEIGVPSPKQRHDILLVLLSERKHSLSEKEVQHLATTTHGFVGADLTALCNEAASVCLRRYVDNLHSTKSSIANGGSFSGRVEGSDCSENQKNLFPSDNLDYASSPVSELAIPAECRNGVNVGVAGTSLVEEHTLKVTINDFEKARMKVRPSAMREVILEVPKVSWKDVGGLEEVKALLREAVEWPQKHHEDFKRIGTRPPTGVLMYGPPGCSKTLLARAVASEAGLNFLAVKGPELFSKWVGESEKAVRSLFAKARANAPSVIFFDEIDGLAVIRGKESDGVSVADRVMSQLLVEMDGLQQRVNVTVIAATNRPDKIDPALLRPGRFDRKLYVGPPKQRDRENIFSIHLKKIPCNSDVCIKELALLTEGFTGADISLICRGAAIAAIEEKLDNTSEITMQHLKTAIEQVQPSETQSYIDLYTKFQRVVPSRSARDRLEYQSSSSKLNWVPFWNQIQAFVLFFYRFPAAFLRPKSSSLGHQDTEKE